MDPLQLFNNWFHQECDLTDNEIPTACCLSTIGLDGYPNARIVSLKQVTENSFIITGSMSSRKGIEIRHNDKVALTFWWPETKKQIRIQGNALKISDQFADIFFSERSPSSQMVSIISDQGADIQNPDTLIKKYQPVESCIPDHGLKRPANWGGYSIKPIRIEFFEFKTTRFHKRMLYELIDEEWTVREIQP